MLSLSKLKKSSARHKQISELWLPPVCNYQQNRENHRFSISCSVTKGTSQSSKEHRDFWNLKKNYR